MTIASALSYLTALPAWRPRAATPLQPPVAKRLLPDP